MAEQVQRRRGTTAQHATFTGALAEITIDTDKKTVVVHDGSTAGGFPLPTLAGTQTWTGANTFSQTLAAQALLDISASGAGQISFPATQNASSGANVLDDYEEGTWTPVLTLSTPGDLNVAYSTQIGTYTKIGNVVHIFLIVNTSTWSYTTGSGNINLTGLPFTVKNITNERFVGAIGAWGGITKAGFTSAAWNAIAGASVCTITMSGSGNSITAVSATDVASGTTQVYRSNNTYLTD